ncbi:MAG: TonB-dependent receptor [Pedobacter sp.]|uniref:SusC/RagA family TonB-linked outer membrane protein n=1 Tax=Pedobacter sp. TaxID=1411316 RepID=UPI0033919289
MKNNFYYEPLRRHERLIRCLIFNLFAILSLTSLKGFAAESAHINFKDALAIRVTGTVTDENKLPLPGVSVRVKGTAAGTQTDVNGKFVITVPSDDANAILVFSYLGYESLEQPLGGKTTITVQLKDNVKTLNEAVVVGYNVVKKSDVTGSVVSVTEEDIRSRPVSNALEAMQGKAAGVDITSSQRPGTMGAITIRGQRSVNASNNPLYVVDGVPLAAGGIDAINPNDIQSIDILKDASATAIYGSRGANGVIIVTTKRGKNGSMQLSYVGTVTAEQIDNRTEMMNSEQYIDFRRDAYRRINYLNAAQGKTTAAGTGYSSLGPNQVDDQRIFGGDSFALANVNKGWVNGVWNGSLVPTTNWTDMVQRTAYTQNHTLSASGGTEKVKAYGSFGYLKQDGTQLGQDFERYTGNLSVDVNPTKWFAMGGSVNITSSIQNYGFTSSSATGPTSLYAAAQGQLPYAIPFNPETGERINLPGGDVGILNPIGEDKNTTTQNRTIRTLGSIYAEATLLPGLKIRSNFGPDFLNTSNGQFASANAINRGGGQPGSTNFASLSQGNNFAYTWDNLLYYNKTIKKHDFGLTLLQSTSATRNVTLATSAVNVPYDKQLWYQLNSVSLPNSFSSNLTQSQLQSYMARVNYTYDSKYLLTASARWDGASQLAPGHKWDFFPSVALAWRMDQEDFLKSSSWINQMKLRFGVGTTGNSSVDLYSSEGRLQALYYTFGSAATAGYVSSDASLSTPIPLPNPDLGWEHTTQYNLGVDFAIFKSRINGVIDIYSSKTTDLLFLRSIPSVLGYTSTYDNVGSTANKGIDLTLNSTNITSKDFSWSTNFSFTANREKVSSLANGKVDDINNLLFIGQRISIYYNYEKIGIWQDTPQDQAEMAKYTAANNGIRTFYPGTIKVADLNGDYKIDANNDRKIVGHRAPDWSGGLNNTFSYKKFELSVFLYARWGFTVPTGAEILQGRYAQRVLDYWTPTNPTNAYPAPNYASATGDTYVSSMGYQDGSYIAIRNISLGYFLSDRINKKLGVSRIKVYAQAANPALLYSKIGWINPDLGTSYYNRGLTAGINVGF